MEGYTNFKKVYISGPFTFAARPEEIMCFYEAIGDLCSNLGLVPYLPHRKTNPWNHPKVPPGEIFFTDKAEVQTSALVIAYVGEPSHGVGMELAYAEMANIPVILLYEKDAKISRILRGIPTVVAEVTFSGKQEAILQLYEVITTMGRSGITLACHDPVERREEGSTTIDVG